MINNKQIDKRRSIGLASKEVGLEGHILRFWEKEFPQIKPAVGKGARRYYYNNDIENILKIKYFLHEAGYTLKGLKNLLLNNKNLFKKDLEEIKKMSKVVGLSDINSDNITENINNLISVQSRLKDFLEKFNKFSL